MAHGKRFRQQFGKVQRGHVYPPTEAMSLIKETASAKFDESVELHVRLGVNVKHAEEQLRGTLALPHGLGRDVRVAVFAQGDKARDAEAAGADVVGAEDLATKIEEGFDEFDVVIATPDQMPVVGRLGRILGPSGKMPNPKVGTVTDDIEKAVGETKSGKVEYRTDRQAIVHMVIGKASFDATRLLDNYYAVMEEINRAKPSSSKGRYLMSVSVSTTMGPGISIDPAATPGEAGAAPSSPNGSAAAPDLGDASVEMTGESVEEEITEEGPGETVEKEVTEEATEQQAEETVEEAAEVDEGAVDEQAVEVTEEAEVEETVDDSGDETVEESAGESAEEPAEEPSSD